MAEGQAPAPQPAQQRYQQFVQLLPLTLQIAGLPSSEPGRYNNIDQMENRAKVILNAFKVARQVARDAIQE